MFRFIIVLSAVLAFSLAYRDTSVTPNLVWDEFGYDGYFRTYNATGERFYDPPSSNAFCVDLPVYYSGQSATNCSIHQDWYCRGWLQEVVPLDFQWKRRNGYYISINTTENSPDAQVGGQCSFYPSEQLHWVDIFQSGGYSVSVSSGKVCAEMRGTAPYRRLEFTWVNVPTSDGPHTNQIRFFETTNELEFILHQWNGDYRPRVGFEGNWVLSPGYGNPGGDFSGFAARYQPAACESPNPWPSMQCVSETRFQTCSNGIWSEPQSCQPGTYCNPDGYTIFCGFTNPMATTTTTTSTGPVTSGAQPITSGAIPVVTTGAPSATCTVGATRCNGAQYQTCVWTWGGSSWVGGWGGNQNCAVGTSCQQYGTDPNTYISCS